MSVLVQYGVYFVRRAADKKIWIQRFKVRFDFWDAELSGAISSAQLISITVLTNITFKHQRLRLRHIPYVNDVPKVLVTPLTYFSAEQSAQIPLPGTYQFMSLRLQRSKHHYRANRNRIKPSILFRYSVNKMFEFDLRHCITYFAFFVQVIQVPIRIVFSVV